MINIKSNKQSQMLWLESIIFGAIYILLSIGNWVEFEYHLNIYIEQLGESIILFVILGVTMFITRLLFKRIRYLESMVRLCA